jgi:hypothetical protein
VVSVGSIVGVQGWWRMDDDEGVGSSVGWVGGWGGGGDGDMATERQSFFHIILVC